VFTFTGKPFRAYSEAGAVCLDLPSITVHPPQTAGRNHGRGTAFNALLEALPDAIVAVDHKGTIVQVNSQALELFGYDRGELVGQKVELLVPEELPREAPSAPRELRGRPQDQTNGAELDLYGRRRNGSEFPVEISLSPISTQKGAFVLSAIRDISDRKRIAEELRRANEELHREQPSNLGNTGKAGFDYRFVRRCHPE